ncbi:MAG: lipid-A-disaccharide synthase [Bacteroidetes bacterium]|nr:lipid-A-disaccharide synthase [Bacteroidota bacterium]
MKYYVIAGEASGDLHASNLIKALKRTDPAAHFRGWGGDLMKEQGTELVKHYRDLAFMGFAEVVANFGTILRNFKICKNDLLSYRPDALILVDYPGFNLRIAEFAHNAGLKVFYYISPQVWAWKKSRVHKIKKFVNRLFVILPFEQDFYARYDYEVDFVGHPLLDAIESLPSEDGITFRKANGLSAEPIIAFLPGSRKQEISKMLPLMLSVIQKFPGFQFVVAGAPSVDRSFYSGLISDKNAFLVQNQTHKLLQNSFAALVTSGTATLETALFNVPEVVCYKGGFISYQIAKHVIDKTMIRFVSLVNLIMDNEVVKELIQNDLTTVNLVSELNKITSDQSVRERIFNDYSELKMKLGGPGASDKAAELIYGCL